MAVPTPYHFTAGTKPTASNMNAGIEDALDFLLNPPFVQVYNSAAQSIADATWTALTWNTETWDTDAMHSTVTNTSRLTCVTAGKYQLSGAVAWASSSAGVRRGARWYLNGGTVGNQVLITVPASGATGTPTVVAPTISVQLGVGDYVELRAYQDTGGALSTIAGITGAFAEARWVSA